MDTYVYIDGFNLYYGSLKGHQVQMAAVASSVRHLRPAMLAASQFPAVMGTIRKPATW